MIVPVPHLQTSLSGPPSELERIFLEQQSSIETWLRTQWCHTRPMCYASIDLRNAAYKMAPIDTNIFPAGFNNLNPDMMPLCIQAFQATMAEIMPSAKRIVLIPEEHSRNTKYFESINVLTEIIARSGYELRIGTLNPDLARSIDVPDGPSIELFAIQRQGQRLLCDDFDPCVILLNNDLSTGIPDELKGIEQPILPTTQMGWAQRSKSTHFAFYKSVSQEFSDMLGIDPWLISPLFVQSHKTDFMAAGGAANLEEQADTLLQKIQAKYQEYHIKEKPFLVVKADAGTYGMAVMMIHDPKQLSSLNRKQRTRMSSIKGGAQVTQAIIQEGVPTIETMGPDNAYAEPVVYLIGRHVVGGFYRVHTRRGPSENLNAPGMDFYPLAFDRSCQAPKCGTPASQNRFYAYGVIARLAMLAASRERVAIEEKA